MKTLSPEEHAEEFVKTEIFKALNGDFPYKTGVTSLVEKKVG